MVTQVSVLSFRGIPGVYLHCLTATPNDAIGVERTGMTRSINRRKWDRNELERLISDLESETGQVFPVYARLLNLRREQLALHPEAPQHIIPVDDRLFCFERIALDGSQRILVVANVSDNRVTIPWAQLPADTAARDDLLGLCAIERSDDALVVEPYAVFWFSLRHDREP
jgi:sucrose phosphorylase